MKEIKTTCDICGKEFKQSDNKGFIRDAVNIMFGAPDESVLDSVNGTFTVSLHGELLKTLDLCAECAVKMSEYAEKISKKEKEE